MTDTPDWADTTEQAILAAALRLVPDAGWTSVLARRAGAAAGLTAAETGLLLPNGGRDLAALFGARLQDEAMGRLEGVDPGSMKIRDRIRAGVTAWLEAAMAHEPAARRWAGYLALPSHLPLGARLYWAAADRLWRWAGDQATDENHYSKRVILSGLLASTLAVRLASGPGAADLHLDRGISAVMRYETFKARFKAGDWPAELASALGRLRYGREAKPVAEVKTPPADAAGPLAH